MKLFLLLVFVSFWGSAQEEGPKVPQDFSPKQDMIAENYWAGAWLMYDCQEGHWVCVLQEDYDVCVEKRAKAMTLKEKHLPCAPIGEFPTKRSCFQRELYLTGQAYGHRFCLLDQFKREELE